MWTNDVLSKPGKKIPSLLYMNIKIHLARHDFSINAIINFSQVNS